MLAESAGEFLMGKDPAWYVVLLWGFIMSVAVFGIAILLQWLGEIRLPKKPDSFLNGPQGPWVGPMAETVAVILLKRPPFSSFNIDNRPHQIIAGQHWAEMAKREEIMKLLKAVRKEALRYLEKNHHFPPEYLKEQYYLYQICQEDSTLLLAILDGRILVGRK